ncbi:MAG: YadA-like family protein [Geobacteraceae bacterium]|nr:YadA-like family protein [Geobacteraceae bacterium]
MKKNDLQRKTQTTALVLGIMWALSGTAMAADAGITSGSVSGSVYSGSFPYSWTGESVSGSSYSAVANSLNTGVGGGLTTVGNATGVSVNGLLTATGGATVNNGATVNGGLTASGTTSINTGVASGNTTVGNASNTIGLTGNSIGITSASSIAMDALTTNTITGGSGNTITATTGDNSLKASVGSNIISAVTSNTISSSSGNNDISAYTTNTIASGSGNTLTANTGANTINALGGNNAINANTTNTITGGTGNTITATAGANNLNANVTTGTNNIEGKYNNIGVTTAASINRLGNTNAATTVTANGGNAFVNVVDGGVALGTNQAGNNTTGGYVATTGSTATIRASNSGTMASNGTTGNLALGTGGGYTAYATSQMIGNGTTIISSSAPNGILSGKTYQNEIKGNTFMDGNVYINGTLDYVSSNSANTSVIGSGVSTSNLIGATHATTAGTAIVIKGSNATYSTVDNNGKITQTTGVADQSSASLTLTNGYGNTHGIVVTENQTTLSGGVHSSSLTMNDNGATFSNAQSGEPIRVHGVKDGKDNYDAVNVRQLASGVAMAAGLAGLPQVEPGRNFNLAAAMGMHMNQVSLAVGMSARFMEHYMVKGGIAIVPTYDKISPAGNVGVSYSW